MRIVTLAALAAVADLFVPTAAAQKFPEKTVTIVIPLGAGGAMDRITRLMGEQLGKRPASR
jgi:tripartite-type tricarboxylate transporter receptor subunit TctC